MSSYLIYLNIYATPLPGDWILEGPLKTKKQKKTNPFRAQVWGGWFCKKTVLFFCLWFLGPPPKTNPLGPGP